MSVELLLASPLFAALDEEAVRTLLAVSTLHHYRAGEEILAEGAPGGRLLLIRKGEVRISKMVPAGGEEALALLRPGEFFGEVEFFDRGPASAHAIAHGDCELLAIPHAELQRLMQERRDLAEPLLRAFALSFAKRLRETNERLAALLSISGRF